jgi:hypothetical protein
VTFDINQPIRALLSSEFDFYEKIPEEVTNACDIKPMVFQARLVSSENDEE